MQRGELTGPLTVAMPSLVVLMGPFGSGKSTFAHRVFGPYEVVSSDRCRAMIADSEDDQSVTPAAFDLLRYIVSKRLAAGRLAVVDATNIHAHARRRNLDVARGAGVPAILLVFDVPVAYCLANNSRRLGRVVPEHVILEQSASFIGPMMKQVLILPMVPRPSRAAVTSSQASAVAST